MKTKKPESLAFARLFSFVPSLFVSICYLARNVKRNVAMRGFSLRFRAEKRSGVVVNVPLIADIRYFGKLITTVGLRLQNIDDYIIESQTFKKGVKVKFGGQLISGSMAASHLDLFRTKLSNAFQNLLLQDEPFTVKDLYSKAFPMVQQTKLENPEETIRRLASLWHKEGMIGDRRLIQFTQLSKTVNRFSRFTNTKFSFKSATLDMILAFKDFFRNEYKYYDLYPDEYRGERFENRQRSENTAIAHLKLLSTIFNELNLPNPLDQTRRKGALMTAQYGEVISLTKDELYRVVDAAVPEELQFVKDCFVVHCSLGARVADYHKMSQGKTMKHRAGFEYIVYAPAKTNARSKNVEVIEAPLLDFASEVLERYGYLPFRDWLFGDITTTYNEQIRQLLEFIGIDRPVSIRTNEGIKQVPLWQEASSKLARKTFVSISDNAPVGAYLAGLHKEGSDAVKHYISKSVEDRYNFLKFAFGR